MQIGCFTTISLLLKYIIVILPAKSSTLLVCQRNIEIIIIIIK